MPPAPFSNSAEKRGVVVVLDRLVGVADRDVVVAHDGAERQRALGDHGAEPAAADLDLMSPQRNSATYVRWLPTSASAPEPGPPL